MLTVFQKKSSAQREVPFRNFLQSFSNKDVSAGRPESRASKASRPWTNLIRFRRWIMAVALGGIRVWPTGISICQKHRKATVWSLRGLGIIPTFDGCLIWHDSRWNTSRETFHSSISARRSFVSIFLIFDVEACASVMDHAMKVHWGLFCFFLFSCWYEIARAWVLHIDDRKVKSSILVQFVPCVIRLLAWDWTSARYRAP